MGDKKPRVSYKTLYKKAMSEVVELTDEKNELKNLVDKRTNEGDYWKARYVEAYEQRGVLAKIKEFLS